jgi:hypothetical protein
MWTISVLQKPRDEPFQARAIGLCVVGHHPIHSRGGYSNGPGLNASFRSGARAFHDSPLGCRMSINQRTS